MFRRKFYDFFEARRNPSLSGYFAFLKKSDTWTLEELKAYQTKKFKELIDFCFDYNPYYQNLFKELGLTKDSFTSLDDLAKIPLIEKTTLINQNKELHSVYDFPKVFSASSSGSTGESLYFMRNEEADSFSRAVIKRGYHWYDVHPADLNGYFWGFNFSFKVRMKTRFLDFLQNRIRIFTYSDKEIVKFVKRIRNARYLQGYSSMIYETAQIIKTHKLKVPGKLKLIKGTSEKILPMYKKVVKQVFGVPMISEYGAAESGIIAFECDQGSMHVTMEGVILECIDGETVITNLHLKTFPIVRYKLGDYIKMAPNSFQCGCGRAHPVIVDIQGRVGKKIVGKKGVYPSLSIYNIIKNLSKIYRIDLIYQVIQEEEGKLDVYVIQGLSENQINLVELEFRKYFKDDIEVSIFRRTKLPHVTSKKIDFISKL